MTSTTRRFRVSPSFVISCVALFAALTGSAFAAGLVGKNSVGSPQIINASVRNADLHDGLIGASKISPNAVDGTKIAPGAIDGTKLAPKAVDGSKVATDTLTAANLAAGSVGASELGTIGVRTNSFTIEAGKTRAVAVLCNSNEKVTGGGGSSAIGVYSSTNRPQGNGWAYTATNTTGANSEVTVYALCLAG